MFRFLIIVFIVVSGVIFSQTGKGKLSDSTNQKAVEEEEIYYSYNGKIIRKITFRLIDVSGPSINEDNGKDTSWFSELTNSLHYTTREWVVRNFLLFTEGARLDPLDISESERLLRESPSFLDARIKIIPLEKSDSVDVQVITKDRWTLTLQVSYNSQKSSYFGVSDGNFLGMGHSLDGTITHDQDPTTGWGTNLKYTAKNVAGYFTDITGGLELNKKSSIKTLDFSRPFVSVKTHFAGGLGLQMMRSKALFVTRDSFSLIPFSSNTIDLWAGYSFPFFFGPSVFRSKTNLIVAGRINRSNFSERPIVSPDSNQLFTNNVTYYLSSGIINRRYYRDNYIQRFGPTEDIPIGGMLGYTWGYEVNEFSDRYYSGVEGVYSRRIPELGYFSLYTAAGGYFRKGRWQQNVYHFDVLYHSKLYEKNEWKWRFFAQNAYVIGTNRYDREQVFLDTENGLRGYDRFSINGVSKGLLKLEGRLFVPFRPLGFAIGINLFSDFGTAAVKGEELFNSTIYQSYGAGLRITNESITKASFDIAFAFMPFTPDKKKGSFAVLFTGSLVLGSRNFNFSKPTVIKYGE